VLKATPTITWPTPAAITYGTALSATQLNTTASTPGTFVYTPAAGTIVNAGATLLSVTFTPTDAANYTTTTATASLTVLKASPVITWATPADITYGTALSVTQLNATASTPGTFVYNPPAGTVLNAGAGQTVSVSVTPIDAANYTTATKTVSINVSKATPVLTWATPADITYGTVLSPTQLNASVSGVPGTFAYTPIAGTALNAGTGQPLSVTFTPTDSTNFTTATKTVSINVLSPSQVITWQNPADITYGAALTATQLNATTSTAGTFTYAPVVGTVLNAGAAQTLSVTFTPTDPNLTTATKTVSINVLKATPTITWPPPAAITYGTALSATQLNATASVPGALVYTPAAGTIVNAGATQILSVTFTPADGANYTATTATTTITIAKATPIINWSAPVAITYGTALSGTQLNATANVPGTFNYAPAAGTQLNAGASQTLSVTFTPTATNYDSATRTIAINVVKATPLISWTAGSAITDTTPLGPAQLNATANVLGAFAYSPADGTVLDAGAGQHLSVTFTPLDASNYTAATATRSIDVSITSAPTSPDLSVWRPTTGTWLWLSASSDFNPALGGGKKWGTAGDKPLKGDIDGDGKPDLIVWRPSTGTFYWLTSSTGYNLALQGSKAWGVASLGDTPMVGDIDGDGKGDLIVWRPTDGTWYWLNSSNGYNASAAGSVQWGVASVGDRPMLADFDGDGRQDIAVWRGSTGEWFWLTSSTNYNKSAAHTMQWGVPSVGDMPFTGDIDGDGKSEFIVWRPGTGTWFWLTSSSGYNPSSAGQVDWGIASLGDVPAIADLDGDRRVEVIVWRPIGATFFWLTSASGYSPAAAKQRGWGMSGDIPVRK